jgi:hypothetical protein
VQDRSGQAIDYDLGYATTLRDNCWDAASGGLQWGVRGRIGTRWEDENVAFRREPNEFVRVWAKESMHAQIFWPFLCVRRDDVEINIFKLFKPRQLINNVAALTVEFAADKYNLATGFHRLGVQRLPFVRIDIEWQEH